MKLTSNIGDRNPTDDSWIGRRLKALEQRVQELAAGAGELSGAVIRRNLLKIVQGGGLIVEGKIVDYVAQVVRDETFAQYLWGALADNPRPDGSVQLGLVFRRDDGTSAFEIREGNAGDGQYAQAWIFRDRNGNIILSEDTNSGLGLARPHVGSGTLVPTDTSRWLQGVETVWTSIGRREYETHNPKLEWNVQTLVDAGVTAQYRWVFNVNGTDVQVGDATNIATLTAPADTYAFGQFMGANVALPPGVQINQRYIVQLQLRITAGQDGTKVAKATCLNFGGDQS